MSLFKRRRENRVLARVQRISELEHDLDILPCSDNDCSSCRLRPPRTVDNLVRQCYDKMIDSTYVKLWRE